MKKRKAFTLAFTILGLLLAVGLTTSPAMGASDKPLSVKSMKVTVWPEYDDPRIMVTYQGEFRDGSAFPQGVNFPVPLGTEMNMVCALRPPSDEHLCQLYDTITGPDALSISYTLPLPTYYLEYYWDGIKGQTDKSFTFNFVSPYAVDSLDLEVQQPLRATDFKLGKPYASVNSDGLGMKYYRYAFNNVTPGQTISVDASYIKADNKPSVAKTTANSGASPGSATGALGGSAYGPIVIAAAILAVALFAFMLMRRRPVAAPARVAPPVYSRRATKAERRAEALRAVRQETPLPARPQPARAAPPVNAGPQGASAAFCSRCGAKLPGGAYFCHVCGAKATGAT